MSEASGPRSIPMRENRVESRDLFVATKEILIQHGGDTYRLRLTGQNKLILTK
ncbi:MAG TPA: hemin uptake protein HemP [Xanthobacteraceae bacterium]|nr:hemin uptake protein HemP [Xanthobacteraceae bacterium]